MGMIWAQKADYGVAAYSLASFVIGTKAYVGTGYNFTPPKSHKFFYEYNPLTDAWTQKADFSGEGRYRATGFSIGNYGYIGCGESQIGGMHVLKDFWQYDPSGDSWTQKTDFGGIARSATTGFSIGNYGYIGCGAGWATGTLNDFWRYDPSADSWSQMADLPGDTRMMAAGFSIGNYGYVATGWHQPNGVPRYRLKELWQYDPSGDSWLQKADFPGTARLIASSWGDGTYGYVLFGCENEYPYYTQDGYYYDPSSDSWTAMTAFTGVGRCPQGFYVAGHGYFVGGADIDDNLFDETWRYEPEVAKGAGSSALLLFAKMLMG